MPITQPNSKRPTAKAEAMAFLSHALASGAVPATEVGRMAREHNLTAKPLRSARAALGVKIARNGFGPGSQSVWSLPGGHVDARPISSEKTNTKDGYEIVGVDPDSRCDYCDAHAGPPGPQSGEVYLVRNPFAADLVVPLHEDCAEYWFVWLSKIPKEICDRMLSAARARMRNRLKDEGGHKLP
jgi:ADP-ribose pyrophosphatase YjhB (NUDIX family)